MCTVGVGVGMRTAIAQTVGVGRASVLRVVGWSGEGAWVRVAGLQPGWRPPFGRVIADGVASADDAGRAGAWAAGERADRGADAR